MNWNNYPEIAEALAKQHSGVDFINIKEEEIRKLVLKLPDFEGAEYPEDSDVLDAILTVWIDIDSDDGEYKAGRYEAYT